MGFDVEAEKLEKLRAWSKNMCRPILWCHYDPYNLANVSNPRGLYTEMRKEIELRSQK